MCHSGNAVRFVFFSPVIYVVVSFQLLPCLFPATTDLSFAVAFFAAGERTKESNKVLQQEEKPVEKSNLLHKRNYSQFLGMLDSVQ